MNPFKAAVYDGVQTYHSVAEDRIRAIDRFDRAQCEAALKLPGLQKTGKRIVPLQPRISSAAIETSVAYRASVDRRQAISKARI